MTHTATPPILAHHLRLCRHLLALWRHTTTPPDTSDSAEWLSWVERRQHLLDRIPLHPGTRLAHQPLTSRAADPVAGDPVAGDPVAGDILAPVLHALRDHETTIIQSLLRVEAPLLRALAARRLALGRRLLAMQRASAISGTRVASALHSRSRPSPGRYSRQGDDPQRPAELPSAAARHEIQIDSHA